MKEEKKNWKIAYEVSIYTIWPFTRSLVAHDFLAGRTFGEATTHAKGECARVKRVYPEVIAARVIDIQEI